jgi:membrane-associated PAP2 superfamily phosphatase
MNRTGLIVALVIAAVTGLAFGIYPDLDLRIARHFYDVVDGNRNTFAWRLYPPLMLLRDAGLWLVALLFAPALLALAVKLVLPRRKLLIPGRAVVFLISTMILGPGLTVNVVLKDYWGRSRPIDVTQFGGREHFVPWWDPRGDCPSNCSFVSGDVSGAFWTIAPTASARQCGGADARHGDDRDARIRGRPFRQRRRIRRRVHVSDHLASARLDLPLAAHKVDRRGRGTCDRAPRHAGL